MRRMLAVAVAAAVALTGCSKPPVSGVVVHKQHSSEVVYYTHPCIAWTRVPYRSGNSTYYTSTCIAWGTNRNVIPEEWQLCIKGPDEDGKITEGCIDVSPQTFARYSENDRYDPAEPR